MRKLGKNNDEILETIEAYSCDGSPDDVCGSSCTSGNKHSYYDENDSLYWEIFF